MITRLNPANEAQAAIIDAMKADASLTAHIPAARIYPQQTPNEVTRPFVKFGAPIITSQHIDGGDGALFSAAIHCFVSSSAAILDPRAFSMDVASHIARVIDGMDAVQIDDDAEMGVHVQQVQCMQEEDASSWHSFVTFRADI